MHPYIPHLLADIAEAHRTEIQLPEETNYRRTFGKIKRSISGEQVFKFYKT